MEGAAWAASAGVSTLTTSLRTGAQLAPVPAFGEPVADCSQAPVAVAADFKDLPTLFEEGASISSSQTATSLNFKGFAPEESTPFGEEFSNKAPVPRILS